MSTKSRRSRGVDFNFKKCNHYEPRRGGGGGGLLRHSGRKASGGAKHMPPWSAMVFPDRVTAAEAAERRPAQHRTTFNPMFARRVRRRRTEELCDEQLYIRSKNRKLAETKSHRSHRAVAAASILATYSPEKAARPRKNLKEKMSGKNATLILLKE